MKQMDTLRTAAAAAAARSEAFDGRVRVSREDVYGEREVPIVEFESSDGWSVSSAWVSDVEFWVAVENGEFEFNCELGEAPQSVADFLASVLDAVQAMSALDWRRWKRRSWPKKFRARLPNRCGTLVLERHRLALPSAP